MFTVPYIRYVYKKIGGFELGTVARPQVYSWVYPYWEAWKIWIGDENVFTLSASVSMNAPLIGVGYWDGGPMFMLNDQDKMWVGIASLDKAVGLGTKTYWNVGEHSFLQVQGSIMIFNLDPDVHKYSLLVGWRQEF
jgi:hypothetical protein